MTPTPTSVKELEPAATRFVGRQGDIEALLRVLGEARLVTVLGAPGVGKTRLARRLLEEHAASLAGAAWFCDLTEATDADVVCLSLSRALGVSLTTAGTTESSVLRLGHVLDSRGDVLLVLDNFEQLVSCAATTVGVWLRMARDARFVVTSRQRLGLPGEVLLDLAPLALPKDGEPIERSEAVQLFVDRASAVRSGWRLSQEEAPVVAELVKRLDGLPLAIELAAARLRVLSPSQVLSNLDRRFQLLGGPPSGGARRTLRGAIEWSYNLLSEPEQSALAQCSVFRGGFGPEAAEAIVDLTAYPGAPWTLDVLQSLRDKSLIEVSAADGESRFSLLVAVRELAAEKLAEAGGEADALERHTSFMLAHAGRLAERVDSAEGVDAVRRLARERENVLAVLRRALDDGAATGRFQLGRSGPVLPAARARTAILAALILTALLGVHGPLGTCLSVLDAALESSPDDVDPALLARALDVRAFILRLMGRMIESSRDCERARSLAASIGARSIEASAEGGLGWVALLHGRAEEALVRYQRALRLFREAKDRRGEGRALAALGDACFWYGDARPHFDAALLVQREVGDRRFEAFTLCKLGAVEIQEARHDVARARLEEALAMARELGDRRCEALALGCLAIAAHEQRRPDEAERLFERSLALHREIDAGWFEGVFLACYGDLLLELDRHDAARAAYEEALRQHRQIGWRAYEGRALARLGALEALQGDERAARAALDAADAALAPIGRDELAAAARAARGNLLVLTDREAARATLRAVLAVAPRSYDVRFAARMLERALAAADAGAPSRRSPARDALIVSESGRWFQRPGGEPVSLQRRRALHLLVKALADLRIEGPGRAMSVADLVERGWPGERIHPESGADRVYMALSTLRKLGLREYLQSRDDGYLLDPRVVVARVPD